MHTLFFLKSKYCSFTYLVFVSDSSPSSVSFINKTKTAVTLQWIHPPTCYEPTRYIIHLLQPHNSTIEFEISPNDTSFTITGLSSGVSYSVEMYTEYGNVSYSVRSVNPVYIQFGTSEPGIM